MTDAAASCPHDVGHGSSASGLLASTADPYALTGSPLRRGCSATDYSCYAAMVSSTWLFVFTAFARSASSLPAYTLEYPEGYMEARMLCVSANQYFTLGSVPVSSGATVRSSAPSMASIVLAVGVVATFVYPVFFSWG